MRAPDTAIVQQASTFPGSDLKTPQSTSQSLSQAEWHVRPTSTCLVFNQPQTYVNVNLASATFSVSSYHTWADCGRGHTGASVLSAHPAPPSLCLILSS